MYPIVEVPPEAPDITETLGTKRKVWVFTDGQRHLFKAGRPNTGENWAEKVCCELAAILQIPHAHYEFAVWRGFKGVIAPKFHLDEARLVLGNELLGKMVKGYPTERRFRARQHRLPLVLALMRHEKVGMPIGYVPPAQLTRASQVFLGYLMLDALVGNQDRHHENWGLISSPGRLVTLAPTFDHASSLGRNELDKVRIRRMTTKDRGGDVEAYCVRARSSLYPAIGDEPLGTFEAFQEASRGEAEAKRYWLDRLTMLTRPDYQDIFHRIPSTEITEPAAEFAMRMLDINRERLLTFYRACR